MNFREYHKRKLEILVRLSKTSEKMVENAQELKANAEELKDAMLQYQLDTLSETSEVLDIAQEINKTENN